MDFGKRVIWTGAMLLAACGDAMAGGPTVDGPFLIAGGDGLEVGMSFDETTVRATLPEGLEPAEGFTGGIDIYTAPIGWGIGPYTAGYLWLDLAIASPDGTAARYMVHGYYGHGFLDLASLRQPVAEVGSGILEEAGDTMTATAGPNGAGALKAVLTTDPAKCATNVVGMGDYVWNSASGFTVMHIPTFAATACEATVVSAEVLDPAAFAGLKPTAILWGATWHNGAAAFAPAEPLKR